MEVGVERKKGALRQLLVFRNYMIMLVANFISRFGDSLDSIAYSWMVYILTGSKLLLGTLFAINALPNIIFGPFAGVIADRFDKKRLIVVGYMGRGIVVSLTAVLFFTGLLKPWHLFVFTIMNSTLETLTSPVFISLIPLLISKDMYLTANSFSSSAYKLAELIGMGTAGAIIALTGIAGAIFIDGGTFFIAVFIIMFIKIDSEVKETEAIGVKGYISDLKEGFTFIAKNYFIRTCMILFALMNFCLAPVNVLEPAFVREVLKGGAEILSILGVAITIGMIFGGIVVAQVGKRFKNTTLISTGIIFFGIDYCLLFLPGNLVNSNIYSIIIAASCYFIFGFTIPLITSPIITTVMLNTDKNMMGRIGAFIGMISCCAIPLGAAITGAISENVPMPTIFGAMGGIITLLGISMMFNKRFRQSTQ